MNMDFLMQLSQEQKLIMTQKMQLSIKLLQMSSVDLIQYINNEFSENPVLDANYENYEEGKEKDKIDYKEMIKYFESDNYGSQSYGVYNEEEVSPFTFISSKKTLNDYLHEQAMEANLSKYTKSIVDYIIENIDSRGYLQVSINDICNELNIKDEEGEEALLILQSFEPKGVGARNLKECLKIQLKREDIYNEIFKNIIEYHLEDIAQNKFLKISKELDITPKKAQEYGDLIKTLEPKPSRGFYTGDDIKFIVPDAEIRKIDGDYFIIMNDSILPKLSINTIYKEILKNDKDKEALKYVKEKMDSALFLIKSIDGRKNTLYKVLECILKRQIDYFEKGDLYLKPMTLKEIAEELEVHESTVSRAIKDKYILLNRGTKKIKDLFSARFTNRETSNEDVSILKIKEQISRLIEKEEPKKPLSDQAICNELNKMEINISRRTVAKYREEMGIKSSSKRKRF